MKEYLRVDRHDVRYGQPYRVEGCRRQHGAELVFWKKPYRSGDEKQV